ncbi:MAG: class I SAM-dependent methyltransferase [Sphingobacteriia bacterium]|nr:class I SAM-dependent methyltransferase [Sphingobacteriia bacterium]NCC41441.1 class I SAM-dependent methyltransferase [Gammaproteobacteria bacterium]
MPEQTERFSADWLSLREPVDHRSRSARVLAAARRWVAGRERLRIVDLGCGSGSNLRYLLPRLAVTQHWVCVDQDAALLARLVATAPDSSRLAELSARVGSLRSLDFIADIDPSTLVTASALLDLVSEAWLAELLTLCRRQGAALLVATTYDGRVGIHPKHPEDDWILAQFNTDQHRDKGLGPALGPDAASRLRQIAKTLGFRLHQDPADWQLDQHDREVASRLVAGWAEVVAQRLPSESGRVREWHRLRAASLAAGELLIRVGHQDLFLEPDCTWEHHR